MHPRCLAAIATGFCIASSLAFGQDADMIRAKLDQAKQAYETTLDEHLESVLEFFDKREKAARNSGNKKDVDQIIADRLLFTQSGELPQSLPVSLQRKFATARAALEKSYSNAIREYTKANLDYDAELTEEEWKKFQTENLLGWTLLFNGRNTDGWIQSDASNATWSVNESVLTGHGGPGFLLTERNDFQNFRLRLEARVDNGNDSGLWFRIQDKNVNFAYEAQFGTIPNAGSLIFFQGDNKVLASSDLLIPPREWFELDLLVNGQDITVRINGKQTAAYNIPAKLGQLRPGRIGLQQSGTKTGAKVQFRKVMIKMLPPS